MIARLGLDAFGVWAVTGALATYAGLLDLGISRSLARFIAVFDSRGDLRMMRESVGLGLIAVALVGALAALVAAAAAPFLSEQLGVLAEDEMRIVLLSSVAIWTFNGLNSVLAAVGIGKRQMVPPNVAATIGKALNFAFSLAALAASTSLPVYALANAAASIVALVPMYLAMRIVWRRPHLGFPSRALVKEILSFSIKNQIGWLADLVNLQTDKIIIALLIDVRAAAVYEIASRVVVAVRSTAILTISAMIPTAAAKIVSEGKEVIGSLYRRYTLRSCSIAFPLFMVASVTAPFLLIAWLGSAPGDSELLIPFLTVAYFVNITTGVGTTIAIGAGHPGLASANSVLIAVLNIILTIALVPFLGLWGVVLGTFLAVIAGSIAFNIRFLRMFGIPGRDLLAAVVPTGAVAIGLAVPPAGLALIVGVPDARPEAIGLLAFSSVLYLMPYWLIATRRGFLPDRLEFPPLRRQRAAATTSS